MGNNEAFSAFEHIVLACYDKGVLDKELLSTFMEYYRDCDIDSGGMGGMLSKNGNDVIDIAIEVFGGKPPEKPKLPENHWEWTEAQDRENEEWQESRWSAFGEITNQFGWA